MLLQNREKVFLMEHIAGAEFVIWLPWGKE